MTDAEILRGEICPEHVEPNDDGLTKLEKYFAEEERLAKEESILLDRFLKSNPPIRFFQEGASNDR